VRARRVLARRDARARRAGARQGAARARGSRHGRAADRDPPGRGGDTLHARARPGRRGHDLGHRQRPARLPHRPVPDPRARHEREDALDRAADARLLAKDGNERAGALAKALDTATGLLLENGKSPSRRVGELDNRGSHFYLALYWARALVEAGDDAYDTLARRLADQEEAIGSELSEAQGEPVDLGGYYFVDRAKADAVMRPSASFNAAIDAG